MADPGHYQGTPSTAGRNHRNPYEFYSAYEERYVGVDFPSELDTRYSIFTSVLDTRHFMTPLGTRHPTLVPTVFIIDDDASIRKSLSRLLRSAGYQAEAFPSAEQFLAREHFSEIGCILLDVQMPGRTGIDLQEELSKADYHMPIIFITGHGDIPMGVQAMKKGAVDFLTKPFDDKELLRAVKSAIEKDAQARTEYHEVQDIRRRIELLTTREYETFRYVITGMPNKQIAANLKIAEKTVKVHRGRVMEKLGVDSVAELVLLAGKVGITPAK